MPISTTTKITDTDRFPVFDSKADLLAAFEEAIEERNMDRSWMRQVLYRLSNTDTSEFGDPTVRHDA